MNREAENTFRENGGMLHMSEAMALGITRYMLYSLRDKGVIEPVSRGLFRLTELPDLSEPDLVIVSARFPKAVICLLSALAFHEMTTQIPHEVSIAIPKTMRIPALDYPPIKVHRLSEAPYEIGIEEHQIDGVPIKIYDPEKTLVDCFRFRNKIGLDVTLEALKLYRERKPLNLLKISKYARICKVEKVMRPYLEFII